MRLSYLQQGFGKNLPVVLLHPFPLNARFWSNQLSGLSNQRHIIAPNFRGYGATRADTRDEFSVERFASDVRNTIDTAQIPRAVYVGCSMGGYVLFELWRQSPEKIAGMIFIDTKAEADSDEAREKRMEMIEKIRADGSDLLPDTAASFISEKTREVRPEVEREVRAWATEPSSEIVVKTVEMLANRPDSTACLSTITVPTLVIVGEEDQVTPPDIAASMAAHIEDASLVTVPDAGHLSPLENPKIVNQAIAAFIAPIS